MGLAASTRLVASAWLLAVASGAGCGHRAGTADDATDLRTDAPRGSRGGRGVVETEDSGVELAQSSVQADRDGDATTNDAGQDAKPANPCLGTDACLVQALCTLDPASGGCIATDEDRKKAGYCSQSGYCTAWEGHCWPVHDEDCKKLGRLRRFRPVSSIRSRVPGA